MYIEGEVVVEVAVGVVEGVFVRFADGKNG